jgi:hypothetical protein
VHGLKHQKEKRSMDHLAGLDVSVKETSVCIVDDTGKIVREVKVASEPQALLAKALSSLIHFNKNVRSCLDILSGFLIAYVDNGSCDLRHPKGRKSPSGPAQSTNTDVSGAK